MELCSLLVLEKILVVKLFSKLLPLRFYFTGIYDTT